MLMPFELKLPNLAITDVSIAAVDRPPLALWITYRVVVLSWSIFALTTAILALLTYIRINVTQRSSFYAPAYIDVGRRGFWSALAKSRNFSSSPHLVSKQNNRKAVKRH